jgi:acylphosphatase
MKNLQIHIQGRVQGVGFRYSAKSMARSLKVSGYVRNLPDDSVFIEAEGEEQGLQEFVRWCHVGPERAIIEKIDLKEGEPKNYQGFETRF